MIEFSATTSERGDWVPLPAGTYDVQIDQVSIKPAKDSTKFPQLQLDTHVVGGAHDNKKAAIWYSLSPKSGWKLRKLLDAAGVDYEANEGADESVSISVDEEDLVGAYVRYNVTQEDYQGKTNNRFNDETASPIIAHASSNGNGNGNKVETKPVQQTLPMGNQATQRRERKRMTT